MASLSSVTQDLAEKLHISADKQEDHEQPTAGVESYHVLNERAIHIHDLTKHTLRQAWLLLVHSVPYKFDAYLEEGAIFPDVRPFARYTNYSSMLYMFNNAVALALCDVVKYEWPAATKKLFGKGTGRPKPEPYAVVIMALAALPKYRGVNVSKRLFDYTVKKANEARIFKLFALTDEQGAALYAKMGFTPCDDSPVKLGDLKVTDESSNPCSFTVMQYTNMGAN
ncbi:hypothetical protein, conserved [Babesia bigemina]|uniref:N-acetyltransferase domain-containing protein n=1 Tax=Babesia bigemina TaxID=5866 RepID=A0A061D9L9_BABBI|nr:hypothetical protein, conserved [Babesia bigemina]CDR96677.1 hypothetical protein, conserved [Babesia bigemina]|eukprot:XP_012768863.1 hypothetical protein, conserved [Babesia bigemina]